MKRNAFVMHLNPGKEAEYRKRHDEIWPELKAELRKAGISNYSIFLDKETNTLFAYQHLADDDTAADLSKLPIVKKWWRMMKDIMAANADDSPTSEALIEVFHLD